MQTRLTPLSWNELVRKLRRLGWDGPFPGKKHPYMVKEGTFLLIPNPHEGDASVDLIKRIMRQGGISRDEWLKD